MERIAWANYCLTNEDGTDMLSRNVAKQLPTLYPIKATTSTTSQRKPETSHSSG